MPSTTGVPAGFHTITPTLTVHGAAEALEFYQHAFGCEVVAVDRTPDGTSIIHSDLRLGDSHFFVVDEFPAPGSRSPEKLGGTPVTFQIYCEDADALFQRAVSAGATIRMEPQDLFWGDRYGQVVDPFGHIWAISTRQEDLTPEEARRRAEAYFRENPQFGGETDG